VPERSFLDLHAEAEEQLFYPALLRLGKGAGGKPSPEAETEDAVHDHNEIRDAVAAVAQHAVGTDGWYQAIATASKVNSDHRADEEREALTDFRRQASLETRHEQAVAFVTFQADHLLGVRSVDKDPDQYIAEHE
jgi:Hemerythrin HHE cation binding domain